MAKQSKTWMLIPATILLVLVIVGWKVLSIYRQYIYAIFPQAQVVFEDSMEPVDIYLNDVHFRVPKAYLYWPAHMKGGKLTEFSMRANIDENMVPWTKSENYRKRVKEGMVTVTVNRGYRKDFAERWVKDSLERQKRNFRDRYDEVNYGIYKDIFVRYDELGQINNTNPAGIGANFYLVPQIETKKPFLISCPLPGNIHHLCTVRSPFSKTIGYDFFIPLKQVEKFLDWDKKVENIIHKLINK